MKTKNATRRLVSGLLCIMMLISILLVMKEAETPTHIVCYSNGFDNGPTTTADNMAELCPKAMTV